MGPSAWRRTALGEEEGEGEGVVSDGGRCRGRFGGTAEASRTSSGFIVSAGVNSDRGKRKWF